MKPQIDTKLEMNYNPVVQKIRKIIGDLENWVVWKEKDTPSEAFEPTHFEAAVCRTWRYQKSDEMMTWKSIYRNHSIVTLFFLQSPHTPRSVTKSVKTLIQTLSCSPLMDAPTSFLPKKWEKTETDDLSKGSDYHLSINFIPLIKLKVGSVSCCAQEVK